ncbi:hypothetical protein CYMTET_27700 [Cymbomonas tetramitiformis]|uniref:Uncharacterized protein n=1 Tax=Cymbomonas tetramitiformis TaxID=36881 RepID=A0AAE0FP86_9CHLO|nr:hypothetical protein CYMTET_27700 [Cymbomonas tetramitiformis]
MPKQPKKEQTRKSGEAIRSVVLTLTQARVLNAEPAVFAARVAFAHRAVGQKDLAAADVGDVLLSTPCLGEPPKRGRNQGWGSIVAAPQARPPR